METRIQKLRQQFDRLNIDAFLINRLSNIRYFCGYSGSNGLLIITRDNSFFITDFRYQEQIKRQVKGAETFIYKKDFPTEFKENPKLHFKGKIGYEAPFLTVDLFNKMKDALPGCEWISTENIAEEIASVKDADELSLIQTAVKITDQVFTEILPLINPGLTESEIAAEIVYRHIRLGAAGNSFDSIIASGVNSSLPHAGATEKKIEKGDFVTLDFGCVYKGYCSDMTRTVIVGKPTAKQKEIYDLVLKAQTAGVEACKAGISGKAVDKVARDIIAAAGYGEYFGHGLGHGLGIEVHAHPRVSFLFDHTLYANQVVTIEPGVYLPDWGGVRIEDDVVIKENGYVNLTKSKKELIIL